MIRTVRPHVTHQVTEGHILPMTLTLKVCTPGPWSIICIGSIFDLSWGDGTWLLPNETRSSTIEFFGMRRTSTLVQHTFRQSGIFQLKIYGSFADFVSGKRENYHDIYITECTSFGTVPLESLHGLSELKHLTTVPRHLPSTVRSLDLCFMGCESLNCPNLIAWDVSRVCSMMGTFMGAKKFNQDIGHWNTANVTNMAMVFMFAETFDQDLNHWDISKVTSLRSAFYGAKRFNGDITTWNTSRVTDMNSLFDGAERFNQDIGNWDTTNVTDMMQTFSGARSFNRDIGKWNTSSVTNMRGMFNRARMFNQNIGAWDTSNVMSMSYMFHMAERFDQDLRTWDLDGLACNFNMFLKATSFRMHQFSSTY